MKTQLKALFAGAVLASVMTACGPHNGQSAKAKSMSIDVTSTAFSKGQPIPEKYTCQGRDISPPLRWTNVPPNTRSFALITDDPDAPSGTWVHWVLYDVPAAVNELPENVARSQYVSGNARQGLNDFKHLGYGGPCPPPGKAHRYFFKLYALDVLLGIKPGATKKDVEAAMKGHVLAEGQTMGTYQR